MKPCKGVASRTGRWIMKKFAYNKHPVDGRRLRASVPYLPEVKGSAVGEAGTEGGSRGEVQGGQGQREGAEAQEGSEKQVTVDPVGDGQREETQGTIEEVVVISEPKEVIQQRKNKRARFCF